MGAKDKRKNLTRYGVNEPPFIKHSTAPFIFPTTMHTELVSVTNGKIPALGQQYSLTCNVALSNGIVGVPTVKWMGPNSSNVITTSGDFTISHNTLTINPLRESHAGQYTCWASVGGVNGTASVTVNPTGTNFNLLCNILRQ